MKKNMKILVPKIGRKLKNFLTDESGKIAKKDVVTLGIGVFIFTGAQQTNAAEIHSSGPVHSNGLSWHANQGVLDVYSRAGHLSWDIDIDANVASLRWHYSWVPSAHQSWYIRGGHVSKAAINEILHGNCSSYCSSYSHSNY